MKMPLRPDTSSLSQTAEQAASDLRMATTRVAESAEAATSLMVLLSGAVVLALGLATAAYVRATK